MDQSFHQHDIPGEPLRTELQRRIDRGEQQAGLYEEICRAIRARLYQRVRRDIKDSRDVEDVVQTIFLKMHAGFDAMIGRDPVDAWIFKVADNAIKDHYREKKKSGGGELPAEFEVIEHDMTTKSWLTRFEDQVDTWVSIVEPVLVYLQTLVRMGALRNTHLLVGWYVSVERMPQQELARQCGLKQPRISQLKAQIGPRVLTAIYLCEILGLVRAPHREAEIRAHLDLFNVTATLTPEDRRLLESAGGTVERDPLDIPILVPEKAAAAIQDPEAGREMTLHELHEAESRYAAALPNPTPHCIESPCVIHTAPYTTEGER